MVLRAQNGTTPVCGGARESSENGVSRRRKAGTGLRGQGMCWRRNVEASLHFLRFQRKVTGAFRSALLRFQRTPPPRMSSTIIPPSASCWRTSSAFLKSRRFRAVSRASINPAMASSLNSAIPPQIPSAAILVVVGAEQRENRVEFQRRFQDPGHVPLMELPRSIEVFTSRSRSNTAAKATDVFRSSSRPFSNSPAQRGSLFDFRILPRGKFLGAQPRDQVAHSFHRTARLLQPFHVKLNCRRYGTESSRKRTVDGLNPRENRSRSV